MNSASIFRGERRGERSLGCTGWKAAEKRAEFGRCGYIGGVPAKKSKAADGAVPEKPARRPRKVKGDAAVAGTPSARAGRPSALLDSRIIYCGDNLEQLAKLPDACVDLIYIDPPFNSNRNYEVFWGETPPRRSGRFRIGTPARPPKAYIDSMRPRCVQLARVLKRTGSFYYHCDRHASHYVKVMLDQLFGENNLGNGTSRKRLSASRCVGFLQRERATR